MIYAILKDTFDEVVDFVRDDDDTPLKWESVEDAAKDLEDNCCRTYIDFIEID